MTIELEKMRAIAGANMVYTSMSAAKTYERAARAYHKRWSEHPTYQERLRELMLVDAVEEYIGRMPTRRV